MCVDIVTTVSVNMIFVSQLKKTHFPLLMQTTALLSIKYSVTLTESLWQKYRLSCHPNCFSELQRFQYNKHLPERNSSVKISGNQFHKV